MTSEEEESKEWLKWLILGVVTMYAGRQTRRAKSLGAASRREEVLCLVKAREGTRQGKPIVLLTLSAHSLSL